MRINKILGKRCLMLVLCFIVVISLNSTIKVKANVITAEIAYTSDITLSTNNSFEVKFTKKELAGRKVTGVKASRKDVYADVYGVDSDSAFLRSSKTGKVTLTFILSETGKSKITKKMTVNFVKYSNPLCKAGFIKKGEMEQLEDTSYVWRQTKKTKEKIDIKPSKGWEILSIDFTWDDGDALNLVEKTDKIKNHSVVKYKSNGGMYTIKLKNVKKNYVEIVQIYTYVKRK